jgi:hypothetical protein
MPTEKPLMAYVVYPPPQPGLPYLAVTLMSDGTVSARRFEDQTGASNYVTEMARGGRRDGPTH